jgi:diguanylate cyclase (GGDEF)-like protein
MADDRLTPYETLVSFLYQAPIGLLEVDLEGRITMANPMAVQLLMPLVREGVLDNLFDAVQPHAPGLRDQVNTLPADPGSEGLTLRLAKGVAEQVLLLRLTRLDEHRLMASVSDITATEALERARIAARVHDVQRIDALTAMPNRQAVLDLLREKLGRAQALRQSLDGLALFLVNLDRFEHVNTRLGAEAGDQVLRKVAARLQDSIRLQGYMSPSCTTARLGGDEFIVLVDGLRDHDDAEIAASRLLQALSQPCSIGDHIVHVEASIGVLMGPQMGSDADSALHDATLAMREAKRCGGGCHVLFQPDTHNRALVTARIEHELRQAIGSGELFVVYQPIMPLGAGIETGVEALVRWQHPVRGLVPPDEFIGVAESSGLIVPLGNFVLEEASRQFMAWRRTLGTRAPGKLSINVSRAQLQSVEFESDLHSVLTRTGMVPTMLQLEITESLAAQNEGMRETLQRLQSAGIVIALDDFGTGYSSLASLHQLPVDVVKIDRSFVRQLTSSTHHRVLVEATLMVAQSLGMRTVAEGVETLEQAHTLKRLNCDSAQGFLYARPLTAQAMQAWLLDCALPLRAPEPRRLSGTAAGISCLSSPVQISEW